MSLQPLCQVLQQVLCFSHDRFLLNLFDTLVKLVIHGIMSFAPLQLSATEEPMLLSWASWALSMSSSNFRVERSFSGSRAWAVQANMRASRGLRFKFKASGFWTQGIKGLRPQVFFFGFSIH